MSKGASIKFTDYNSSVAQLLKILNLGSELKKYDSIVLKIPFQDPEIGKSQISLDFVESVLKYVLENKNPVSSVFLAEGADGLDTSDLFSAFGYKDLADKYGLGLIDLNTAESDKIYDGEFLKFDSIMYPKILLNSFIISLAKPAYDEEIGMSGSLSNMLGCFPAKYYKGFFTKRKTKIRAFPLKFSIHDILKCKLPQFSILDCSENGSILAGLPLEMDKQAAKLLNLESSEVPYLSLIEESFFKSKNPEVDELI